MKRYVIDQYYAPLGECIELRENDYGDLCKYSEVKAELAKKDEEIARLRKALEEIINENSKTYKCLITMTDALKNIVKIAREALEKST